MTRRWPQVTMTYLIRSGGERAMTAL